MTEAEAVSRDAIATDRAKTIAIWRQWVGIAKYLARTGKRATYQQLQHKLALSRQSLELGIQTLQHWGFAFEATETDIQVQWVEIEPTADTNQKIETFLQAVREEQFQQQYFQTVPLETIKATAGLS